MKPFDLCVSIALISSFSICCMRPAIDEKTKIIKPSTIFTFLKDSMIRHRSNLSVFEPQRFKLGELDSFVFNANGDTLRRFDTYHEANGSLKKVTTTFIKYRLSKRDRSEMLPNKIEEFELKGVYTNNSGEDNVGLFCFYFNPKTNDIIQLIQWFYIGNPWLLSVFAQDSVNPFKGNAQILDKIMVLDKPFSNRDTTQVNFEINVSS